MGISAFLLTLTHNPCRQESYKSCFDDWLTVLQQSESTLEAGLLVLPLLLESGH